ncbi:MAG: hypothetical protein DKM22_05545 [Candidatus Melainabacteria bacterium]|nr:MAG: hypothetical protein DKM22_05545 [Candidatus Melainabacteria bacterium]
MVIFQCKSEVYMDLKGLLSKNKEIDILSYIPDGVVLIDSSGYIEKINDVGAKFFRKDKQELLKEDINNLIESGFELIKQTVLNGQSVVGKVKSEECIYLEITASPAESSFVVSLRDVTQNYKTVTNIMIEQESSKKNNKDKNNFLVKLSNEFRSPLQSIIGFSQAMIDGLGGQMSEKQDKYIKIINKNSVDALSFMNKIIDLAKTESNNFEYDTQIFDVVNAIGVDCKEYETAAKEKNLTWNFDASEITKKSIFSDEGALRVVLKNILEICLNMTDIGSIGIKMFHPERDVVVEQGFEVPEEDYNEKSYLMIVVSDTGSGYSDAELEIAFEPYTQIDKPNKKNIARSIALATVKNIIKHMKGSIWIESTLMQGSSYNIIIPTAR